MRLLRVLLVFSGALSFFAQALGEDVSLERIVVTPYRFEEDIFNAPVSTAKISRRDIANSNSQKVVDVLRGAEGLVVRDWYGNGAKAAVDIRGFGEQAALNVLVLVDGRRVNEVDLSGVDWTQIPLEQVESIEIIRGGSGSVLYGDNASSGVINIITKSGRGKPSFRVKAGYGSYASNSESLSFSGSGKKFSYLLDGNHQKTSGYRSNSYYGSEDYLAKFAYEASDIIDLSFQSGFHSASYGLPASLYQYMIDANGRRYAKYGKDHARDKDYYFTLGAKGDFSQAGRVEMPFSYRIKDTDTYFLTSGLDTRINSINTFGFTPKYTLEKELFFKKNKLITGFDLYLSDYSSNCYNVSSGVLQNFTDINRRTAAGYIQDELFASDKLIFSGGYRYESANFSFDYHDQNGWNPDIDKDVRLYRQAFDIGAVFNWAEGSNLYLNFNRSFRFPAVDEFTYFDASWQQQLNTGLKPQSSLNYEAGLHYNIQKKVALDASIYRMNLNDEIYLNYTGGPLGFGENQNYDRTLHQGLELKLLAKPYEWLELNGNYSYTDAEFVKGDYSGNSIPLVPENKASAGFRLSLPKNITFNFLATYVGKRYFLNDQANAQSKLNCYLVCDMNLSLEYKGFNAVFGVNNLFNRIYSEYAGYNGFVSDKFYYPSPERNFIASLEYKF